jgi:hypothetical protein
MINPGEIPQIPGDVEAVARHGGTLQSAGKSFGSTGSDVHSTWQGLSAFYSAPEAAELFAATGPVKQKTETVGSDIATVGTALVSYADEVRPIKARLASLQSEAQTFVNSVAGDDGWRKDGDKVNHNNQLLSDVSGQISAWMAAQRRCANTIDRLSGGIQYVEDNGDGTRNANEFGYSAGLLNQAAAGDDGVPWGKPDDRDKPWYEDVGDAIVSFGKGVVVDGLWGTVKGLGNLAGFGGWDGLKQSWGGLLKLGLALSPPLLIANQFTALPGLPKGTLPNTLRDTGKALLAWDQWKDDPARASGNVVFNVASVVFGTKGAGAASKGISTAARGTRAAEVAARVSVKVSEVVATIKSKLPTLKLPEFLTPKTVAYALDEDYLKNLPDSPGNPHLPDGTPPNLPDGVPGKPDLPDANPGDPAPPTRPVDDLPPPKVEPPEPLPPGVTDDPATWPGRIVQDNLDPKFHFSLEEEAIAKRLAQHSPGEINPIPTGADRTADALVDGKPIEFKTVKTDAPDSATIKSKLSDATAGGGQSDDVIIDARGSNLTQGDAIKGLARFFNSPGNANKVTRVRIWGRDFDLDWRAND